MPRFGLKDRSLQRLDELVSEYVRRRAIQRVGGCERCLTPKYDLTKENGQIFPAWKQLQCSHFHGRSRMSTRFSERNLAGLCGGCHLFLEHHPHEHETWFRDHLGEVEFNLLTAESCQIGKPDISGLILYFTEKLKEFK